MFYLMAPMKLLIMLGSLDALVLTLNLTGPSAVSIVNELGSLLGTKCVTVFVLEPPEIWDRNCSSWFLRVSSIEY